MVPPPPPTLDTLTDSQRAALSQFTAVTAADISIAIPLLHRSQWNVEIAISKFFDGERPDPVAEAIAAQAVAAGPSSSSSSSALRPTRPPPTRALTPAPRIPPTPNQLARRPPLPLQILFFPFSLLYRLSSSFISLLYHLLPFLPRRTPPPTRATANPIDTAQSFIHTFTDAHPHPPLPWQPTSYTTTLDLAKQTLQFLLVVLVSPHHDAQPAFAATLTSPQVVAVINDSNLLLWGGDVSHPEPYQVATALRCTTFPFAALIAHTPQGMAVVTRISGPTTPTQMVRKIQAAIDAYSPDIDRIRAQRAVQAADREIRAMQESAYERSLAADRAKAEKRRAELQAVQDIEMQDLKREQWRRWRRGELKEEPMIEEGGARVSIRMADGERVVRRFGRGWDVKEVYDFIETRGVEGWEGVQRPEGYRHKYKFRVCGVMPRKVFMPEEGTVEEFGLWPSGNLVVEEVDDDDEEDEE